jgi:glycine cleavage system T protein
LTSSYADQFFGVDIHDVDPLTDTLIRLEEERQRRRIILIPSESYVPQSVRQGLGSVFTNIYAEGYPPSQMVGSDEALLADLSQQLAYYRRYADRRFYKGADYVHFVESLAQRRAAECFANARAPADRIYANVQPLSGAAANLAVYDALMAPGDVLMGMDLFQGGHLTHGSEFNVSGKQYQVFSYGVDANGRLDYEQIRALAEAHRPKVIVAGYTSYPWAPDFAAFREIADAVGAYLMADIAHPAGMAIAGVYPNPVGIADVVVFTTHKTLCGPRGACILTTNQELSRKVDQAVFPGLQGGPHTNKFAAMCVAFEIARTDAFRELQRAIVDNAQALAKGLTDRGLDLAYGGTDTHLLLLDLQSVRHPSGEPLYGEVMARILDLAGIVVNKNTIPGDTVTALATGIRMGTPWVTERGMGAEEMDRLADCIARLVHGVVPFTYQGTGHPLPRGKIDLRLLEEVKQEVDELACGAKVEIERGGTTYPHFCVWPGEGEVHAPYLTAPTQPPPMGEGKTAPTQPPALTAEGSDPQGEGPALPPPPLGGQRGGDSEASTRPPALAGIFDPEGDGPESSPHWGELERGGWEGAAPIDMSDLGIIHVSGWRAQPFLQDLCTVNVAALDVGEGARGFLLDRHGDVIDDVAIWRELRDARGRDSYLLFANPENTGEVLAWLRAVSDGYVLFDEQDVWRKVRGPATVELLSATEAQDLDDPALEVVAAFAVLGPQAPDLLQEVLSAPAGASLALPERGHWVRAAFDGREVALARDGYTRETGWYMLWGPYAAMRAAWDALSSVKASVPLTDEGSPSCPGSDAVDPTVGAGRSLPSSGAKGPRPPASRHALRTAAGLPASWPPSSPSAQEEEKDARKAATYLDLLPHFFDRRKPYFVGQDTLPSPPTPDKPAFAWSEPADAPLKRTPLHEEHERMGAKLVLFAGWEMPVWYTRVSEEHQAVREAVGLFDVAHMGTLEVVGPNAADFLDAATVNYVRWLEDGESQYSALLDPEGQILDDMIVYRRAWDCYFVVVNASNFDKDWAWLNAVNENRVTIDADRPWVEVTQPVTLRNLKDPASGPHQRVDLALQGPHALHVLLDCEMDAELRAALRRLPRTSFVEGQIVGADGDLVDLLISRTGYTGESIGYELYVHPDRAVTLWRTLLSAGKAYGILACGLAARDSLRIEAGLPLYEHELDGPLGISQTEAGFGAYVKYHKPFFVGRAPYKAYNDHTERQLVRFAVDERGARALRGGEHGEPVVNHRGNVIGTVTSCALVGDHQVGMALVDARYTDPGTGLFIYPEARRIAVKAPDAFEVGDRVALPVPATVLSRFPIR